MNPEVPSAATRGPDGDENGKVWGVKPRLELERQLIRRAIFREIWRGEFVMFIMK
jgi:hypothetical protein